jgi:phosphoglucomutase
MLFAEMVCYYKSINITIYQRLQELFKKFGYYKDMSVSTTYSGIDGMDKMAAIMNKLHNTVIKNIGNEKVLFVSDYEKRITVYNDGKTKAITLSKTNALYYGLNDNNWMCVRPSGTEPKLKIYVSISDNTSMEKATDKAEYLIKCMKEML